MTRVVALLEVLSFGALLPHLQNCVVVTVNHSVRNGTQSENAKTVGQLSSLFLKQIVNHKSGVRGCRQGAAVVGHSDLQELVILDIIVLL